MERFGGSGHRYVRKEATIHSVWSSAVQHYRHDVECTLHQSVDCHRFHPFLKKTLIRINPIFFLGDGKKYECVSFSGRIVKKEEEKADICG